MKKIGFKGAAAFIFAAVCCTFLFVGCSKADEDVVKIGGIFPLSGDVAVYGIEARNGIQMAIDEINAAGGIRLPGKDGEMISKKVVLYGEDDEGNPEKSVSAYKKLTTKDGVKLIIGSLTSGCVQAITALAQAQKVLMIAPAATMESITDAGNFVFRACFIDPFQGTVGGMFAAENLGARKAAVLYDIGNDYSVGLSDNFIAEFERQGGTIVAAESYSTGDKDFNAQLTKIKNANPDVVYLPDYYATVSLIAKQLRAQGIMAPIVGADGWGGLSENAGDEVLNGFYSDHYAADSTDPKVVNFVNNYQAKFGTVPVSFAALGYDSMFMMKDAIERAGTTDPVAVQAALEKTDGNYVTGSLTFDSRRNPIKSAVMLEIIKGPDGKLTPVYKATVNP